MFGRVPNRLSDLVLFFFRKALTKAHASNKPALGKGFGIQNEHRVTSDTARLRQNAKVPSMAWKHTGAGTGLYLEKGRAGFEA